MDKLDPNPYCESLPTQLKYFDSTAIRQYCECPRKYELGIVKGYRIGAANESFDLTFGSYYHDLVELFDTLVATGTSKAEATEQVIEKLLAMTWADGKPWAGEYQASWRCGNWVPAAAGKRTKYNCEASRSWWQGHRQGSCPKCAHRATNRWVYVPEERAKVKNRYSLFASVLEYCDQYREGGGVQPLVFPDGQIALEHSFQLPLGFQSPDGDPYILCGHMDSMVSFAGERCVRERKTTRTNVSASFWDRYAPDVQIDNYDLASQMLYGETLHPTCVMVEVMQVDAHLPKLHRGLVSITEGRREETLRDLGYWIARAEADAVAGYYPKNTSACHAHGRSCQFRRVCAEEPGETRERMLENYYRVEKWNPRKER